MKIIIETANNCSDWNKEKWINKSLIKNISKKIFSKFDSLKNIKTIEISLLFTDNDYMKQLKKDFLQSAKVTNVLSFPDAITSKEQLFDLPANIYYLYLGDIAFGYQIIKDEATAQQKIFKNHFIHLLVHSILHLIGFDHQTDEEASTMENLEIDILNDFEISAPY